MSGVAQGRCAIAPCPRVRDLVVVSLPMKNEEMTGGGIGKFTVSFLSIHILGCPMHYKYGIMLCVTNFIRPYLYQLFNNSHGPKTSLKPLRRLFD